MQNLHFYKNVRLTDRPKLMKSTLPGVPLFKLYGENQAWPGTDLLHCEPIPARSRLHHWEIKPHQHAELFQLLHVQRGQAQVEIEGTRTAISEAAIQVVTVHGFRFSADIQGHVLTFGAALVANLEQRLGAPLAVLSAGKLPAGPGSRAPAQPDRDLAAGIPGQRPIAAAMLEALVTALMVDQPPSAAWAGPRTRDERDRQLLGQYLRLVEAHYREHLSIEAFAARLNCRACS